MYFYSCAKPSSVSYYRSTRMVIGGGKSNATKDLLRSMLHAWYDLTKDEAGAWTAQLEWEVALQQQMNNPVSSCCWLVRGYISSSFKCEVAACFKHASFYALPPDTNRIHKRVPHARRQHRLPDARIRPQEQVTKLIREVLFRAWRQYATNPLVRLERKKRPASKSAWVRRMMAPKNTTARGAEGGDRGWDSRGRRDSPGPLGSTLEKEVCCADSHYRM